MLFKPMSLVLQDVYGIVTTSIAEILNVQIIKTTLLAQQNVIGVVLITPVFLEMNNSSFL